MKSKYIIIFLLSIFVLQTAAVTTNTSSSKKYTNYLKTACNMTTYPKECYKTLSPYTSTIKTNDLKLCTTALSLTLKATRNISSLVAKVLKQKGLSKREVAVVKDCVEVIGESIDELKQSLKAMANLKNSADRKFQIDNVKTWVSAAITDETTCTDGFDGIRVRSDMKNKIRNNVVKVGRLTSNALALINNLY